MTDAITVALITAVPATIAAVVGVFGYVAAREARKTTRNTNQQVAELKISVDGRLQKMLEMRGDASFAEGIEEARKRALEK